MSKGKRKRGRSQVIERRAEIKEVPVPKEGAKPTKFEIAGFIVSFVGVIATLGIPGILVRSMVERAMATAWVYPVLNAVFGVLLVFLVSKYRKLNQTFIMQGMGKLTGRKAEKTEHPVQTVMYVVIFLAGWWVYFTAVVYQYAFTAEIDYSSVFYKVLQCINMVAVVVAGLYKLAAVELKDPPYKEVYRMRFWIVQGVMLIVWGVTGIVLFTLG